MIEISLKTGIGGGNSSLIWLTKHPQPFPLMQRAVRDLTAPCCMLERSSLSEISKVYHSPWKYRQTSLIGCWCLLQTHQCIMKEGLWALLVSFVDELCQEVIFHIWSSLGHFSEYTKWVYWNLINHVLTWQLLGQCDYIWCEIPRAGHGSLLGKAVFRAQHLIWWWVEEKNGWSHLIGDLLTCPEGHNTLWPASVEPNISSS